MKKLDLSRPKLLKRLGVELDLQMFAMTENGDGSYSLADENEPVKSFDVLLRTVTEDPEYLFEFEDVSYTLAEQMVSYLEKELNIQAEYLIPRSYEPQTLR